MAINYTAIENYLPEVKEKYETLEKYYRKLTFEDAIEQAAKAIVPREVKQCIGYKSGFDSHQRRVGKKLCKIAAEILGSKPYLEQLYQAKSFEDIFDVTEKVKRETFKLGDLWSYDTALRISLHKGWYPEYVYLQTGAKGGAKTLKEEEFISKEQLSGQRKVSPDILPDKLGKLPPHFIENILCVGKRKGWFISNIGGE
jgi:hypothetical protein